MRNYSPIPFTGGEVAIPIIDPAWSSRSSPWKLDVMEGVDHFFYISKSMGIKDADIFDRVVKAIVQ